MINRLILSFLLLPLAIGLAQQAAEVSGQPKSEGPPEPGAVSGKVYDLASGSAIADAEVTTFLTTSPFTVTQASTDKEGRFVVNGLPPGKYEISAARAGYGPATTTRFGRVFSRHFVEVRSGQNIESPSIRLEKAGIISGRIVGEDGEGLSRVRVTAYLLSLRSEGRPSMSAMGRSVETNDKGEYRLFDLTPSSYYVVARPILERVTFPPENRSGGGDSKPSYVEGYYPGVESVLQAGMVSVRSGRETVGVDFRLRKNPVSLVSGNIRNNGIECVGPLIVTLRSSTGSAAVSRATAAASNGNFQFDAIPWGVYRLFSKCQSKSGASLAAEVEFLVDGKSDNKPQLSLNPAAPVHGKLVTTSSLQPKLVAALATGKVKIRLVPLSFISSTVASPAPIVPVAADGSFVFEGVDPGPYATNLSGIGGEFYVERVRQGSIDHSKAEIVIGASSTQEKLEVRIGESASLAGIVVGTNDKPEARCYVVVVPYGAETARGSNWSYIGILADEQGSFSRAAIRPGRYRVFGFNVFDSSRAAELVGENLTRSSTVEVEAGQTAKLKLTMIEVGE